MSTASVATAAPKALVLAAGLGTRLRPLTTRLPKPLLPVCGQPVAARTLSTLARAGCRAVALNLHHQGESICNYFGEHHEGMALTYSREPTLLGTLGALLPLRDFLADASAILLVNGDALCRWPWKALLKRHFSSGADATLLLSRHLDVDGYGGGVGRAANGRIAQLRDGQPVASVTSRHVFTGAHILSPRLLEHLRPGFADIVGDLYMPLLAAGRPLESVLSSRRWHDLGTPARYLAGCLDWRRAGRVAAGWRRSGVAPSAQIAAGVRLRQTVIEADCEIGTRVTIEGSVVLAGARIAAGSRLLNSLIGPQVQLPKSRIEDRMICHPAAHEPLDEKATLLGDLLYIPLER